MKIPDNILLAICALFGSLAALMGFQHEPTLCMLFCMACVATFALAIINGKWGI